MPRLQSWYFRTIALHEALVTKLPSVTWTITLLLRKYQNGCLTCTSHKSFCSCYWRRCFLKAGSQPPGVFLRAFSNSSSEREDHSPPPTGVLSLSGRQKNTFQARLSMHNAEKTQLQTYRPEFKEPLSSLHVQGKGRLLFLRQQASVLHGKFRKQFLITEGG